MKTDIHLGDKIPVHTFKNVFIKGNTIYTIDNNLSKKSIPITNADRNRMRFYNFEIMSADKANHIMNYEEDYEHIKGVTLRHEITTQNIAHYFYDSYWLFFQTLRCGLTKYPIDNILIESVFSPHRHENQFDVTSQDVTIDKYFPHKNDLQKKGLPHLSNSFFLAALNNEFLIAQKDTFYFCDTLIITGEDRGLTIGNRLEIIQHIKNRCLKLVNLNNNDKNTDDKEDSLLIYTRKDANRKVLLNGEEVKQFFEKNMCNTNIKLIEDIKYSFYDTILLFRKYKYNIFSTGSVLYVFCIFMDWNNYVIDISPKRNNSWAYTIMNIHSMIKKYYIMIPTNRITSSYKGVKQSESELDDNYVLTLNECKQILLVFKV